MAVGTNCAFVAGLMAAAAPADATPARPAPAAPLECQLLQTTVSSTPVLTDAQVSADLHAEVVLASVSSGTCRWNGPRLAQPTLFRHYTVALSLDMQSFSTPARADAYAKQVEAGGASSRVVPGPGVNAVLQVGQGQQADSLTAVTASNVVFQVSLFPGSGAAPLTVIKTELLAVAKQVLTWLSRPAPYQHGRALAQEVDALAAAGSFRALNASLENGSFAAEVHSNEQDGAFASGLANHLTADGAASLVDMIGSGYVGASAPSPVRHLETLLVSAYGYGRVKSMVTRLVTTNLANYEKGSAVDYQTLFLSGLARDPVAATNFLQGLTPDQIAAWSQQNQGIDHETEDVAVAAVEANWQGYADHLLYKGPLHPSQLAVAMYAATRDNRGRAAVTNQIGPWFIAHGGVPDVSAGASVPDLAHLGAWLAPLVDMNAAVAKPTGRFLDVTENEIQAGILAAYLVGEFALGTAGVELIAEAIPATLVSTVVGASTVVRDWFTLERSFTDALDAGLLAARLASGAADYEKAIELIGEGIHLAGAIHDIVKWNGDLSSLNKIPSYGARAELHYYLIIIRNTFHEAVARLMQEHMVVNRGLQPHWEHTVSAVDQVTAHPNDYFVVPPGASGPEVPAPPRTPGASASYRGIPMSYVAAVVFSQFVGKTVRVPPTVPVVQQQPPGVRGAVPGYASPKQAVAGFLKEVLVDDNFAGACMYVVPAQQSPCQTASLFGDGTGITGGVKLTAEVTEGDRAIVAAVGRLCSDGKCEENANPRQGLPSSPAGFDQAYQAAVATGASSSAVSLAASCLLVNGRWYVNLGL